MQEVSILAEECANFPGVRRMFYGFKSSFVSLGYPRHINQWRVTNIELKENKALGQLYFIPESANFDEAGSDTNHGDVYRLSARGRILSTNELLTTLLMAISREEVILFIEDEKNNIRVIGNLTRGAKLSIDMTSNVISGSLFGYSFSVNHLSDGPAYWYLGEIVANENTATLVPPPVPPVNFFKHDFSDPYSYCGYAIIGTSEDSSSWNITRIEVLEDGTTVLKTATGAWTERLILIYT